MQTESPILLSDICGAADIGSLAPVVAELIPNQGTLVRGTVLSVGLTGKLELTTAGNEAQATGVLLDSEIDTDAVFEDGSITGSVARHGSFKAEMLTIGAGADSALIAITLRDIGILLEGQLVVPAAAA